MKDPANCAGRPDALLGDRTGAPPDAVDRLFRLSDLITPWAIRTVAKLRLADALADGPRGAAELARTMSLQPRALGRLLRFLAGLGLFSEMEPGRFALTPMGRLLGSDSPVWASLVGPYAERVAAVPTALEHSLRTGGAAFDELFGESVAEFCAHESEANRAFNDGMAEHAASVAPAISAAYEWQSVHHVVDVGGGTGHLVARILQDHTDLHATLFDLPNVVAEASPVLAAAGVAERCRVVAGDFFSTAPVGGDCYLLSHVVHDWPDEHAAAILRTCRNSMTPGATLLLAEAVVPEGDAPHPSRYRDIRMLLMFGGLERTKQEFEDLLAMAGFQLSRLVDTASLISLIEARPL